MAETRSPRRWVAPRNLAIGASMLAAVVSPQNATAGDHERVHMNYGGHGAMHPGVVVINRSVAIARSYSSATATGGAGGSASVVVNIAGGGSASAGASAGAIGFSYTSLDMPSTVVLNTSPPPLPPAPPQQIIYLPPPPPPPPPPRRTHRVVKHKPACVCCCCCPCPQKEPPKPVNACIMKSDQKTEGAGGITDKASVLHEQSKKDDKTSANTHGEPERRLALNTGYVVHLSVRVRALQAVPA